MKYVEPLNSAAYPEREGKYVTANPSTGLKGSTVPAEAIEHAMREIVHVIEMAGLDPNSADLTQLYKAILLLYPEFPDVTGFLPLSGGTMQGSILATGDNTISMGSALKRWKEIFAVRFRGIADSADKLQTSRNINNVPFNGTTDITIYDPTKAAIPKTTAGAGQWININASGCTLPAGGTWAYFIFRYQPAYENQLSSISGLAAGGTVVVNWTVDVVHGFAWRIA